MSSKATSILWSKVNGVSVRYGCSLSVAVVVGVCVLVLKTSLCVCFTCYGQQSWVRYLRLCVCGSGLAEDLMVH